MKLSTISRPRHILSDTNTNNCDQLYQLIKIMENIVRLEGERVESPIRNEGKTTQFYHSNGLAALWHILGYPPFKEHHIYMRVK